MVLFKYVRVLYILGFIVFFSTFFYFEIFPRYCRMRNLKIRKTFDMFCMLTKKGIVRYHNLFILKLSLH